MPVNILIADDDTEDLELYEEVFRKHAPAASLVCVSNGKEVLDHLHNCTDDKLPQLLILDYNMPLATGAEVLIDLNRNKRFNSLSCIILSTSASEFYRKQCIAAGASAYFAKPGNMRDLELLVAKILTLLSTA